MEISYKSAILSLFCFHRITGVSSIVLLENKSYLILIGYKIFNVFGDHTIIDVFHRNTNPFLSLSYPTATYVVLISQFQNLGLALPCLAVNLVKPWLWLCNNTSTLPSLCLLDLNLSLTIIMSTKDFCTRSLDFHFQWLWAFIWLRKSEKLRKMYLQKKHLKKVVFSVWCLIIETT